MANALKKITDATTFGEVYDAIVEANKVTPMDLPNASRQLARIVGGIFTMVVDGEFAAPTAGRLMHEAAVGVIRMALDEEINDYYRPLRWEGIAKRDTWPIYVSAMLLAVKPYMDLEDWAVLGGRLYSNWALKASFPKCWLDELEEKYEEILDEQQSS